MRAEERVPGSPRDHARTEISPEEIYARYARRLVRDVLEREPAPHEVKEIVDALFHGVSRRRAAMRLLCSQEKREQIVRQYYARFLHREPSAEGLELWTGLLAAGRWQEEILNTFLSSTAYLQRCGNSLEDFVRNLFFDCLRRPAPEAEVTAISALLRSGTATRDSVTQNLLGGNEFRQGLILEWHVRYLRRAATPRRVQQWLFKMRHHSAQEHVQAALLSSREYFRSACRG